MKRLLAICVSVLWCGMLLAQTPPANVPTDGLVAYYGFDGNANDLSGNGNDGTLATLGSSNPTFCADRYGSSGSACEFGGMYNPNYVEVAPSSSLNFGTRMSISFWVMQTTHAGGNRDDCSGSYVSDGAYASLISRGTASNCGGEAGMMVTNYYLGNTQQFFFFNNNTDVYANTMFSNGIYNCYSNGEWVHCVIIADSGRLSIYINGALVLSERPTPSQPTLEQANQRKMLFGIAESGEFGIYPFEGVLDDIAFYNRAISADEVASLYNGYSDPNSSEQQITISSIDIVNPCGNSLGTITINPTPVSGVTYQYSATSLNDLQADNVISRGPGTYNVYVASSCRQWDSTVTLVCDCGSDPTYVDYQTICEGVSGQTGQQYEPIASHTFEGNANGWSTTGYWARGTGESNYYNLGLTSSYFSAHTGSYALFCSHMQSSAAATFFPVSTSSAISQGIDISYDPSRFPVTASFWVYATGFGSSNGTNYYSTLRLYYSTSASGPWTQLWSISGGGHGDWEQHTVPLSSYITEEGTYYFKLECEGAGYSAGFDDFTITADTRWVIPTEVSAATAGDTVRTEKMRESEGSCPITDITYWTILGVPSYDTVTVCDSLLWYGQWRYNSTNVDETVQTLSVATVNNTTCDSTLHHSLIVYHSDQANVQRITACDRCEVFGATYSASAAIRHVSTTDQGCESVDSVYLTINRSSSYDTSITSCNPITWRGATLSESVEQSDTLTTVKGCDSVLTLSFTRTHSSAVNIQDSFCENSTYRFAGRTLTQAGEYDAHMTDHLGCDSSVHLSLRMLRRPDVMVGYKLDCLTKEYMLWGSTNTGRHLWQSYPADPSLADHLTDDTLYLPDHENYTFIYTAELLHDLACPTTKEVVLPTIIETRSQFVVRPDYVSIDNPSIHAIDVSVSEGTRLWFVDGVEQRGSDSQFNFRPDLEKDSVMVTQVIVNGNCRDTSSVTIPIIRNTIYVPNVFTPLLPSNNTDISNSYFRAYGDGIYDYSIHIFNRFGQLVFEADDIATEWDGRYKGEYCPQGGYTYIIRYRDPLVPGDYQVLRGVVTLLH